MSKYDKELVDKVITNFKQRRNLNKPVTVLFDADNTLYRFSTYGMMCEAVSDMYTKGFFKNLSIFPEAPSVIENLQKMGIRCGIITTPIDSPYCVKEKLESFSYYFPMIKPEDIYICNAGDKKPDLFKDISDIVLVDDFHKNINDWYKAGGVAIKKSYSGKARCVPVVTSLIDLFSVLNELKVY